MIVTTTAPVMGNMKPLIISDIHSNYEALLAVAHAEAPMKSGAWAIW